MSKCIRAIGALALVSALLVPSACKKKQHPGQPGALGAEADEQMPVPKEVLVHIGMKSPQQSIDTTLGLLQQLLPLPLTRDGLLDLLAQRARLPRELIDAVDITKPIWIVGMDRTQLEERDPSVMVLFLRSRGAFEKALAQKMKKTRKEGDLEVYMPKPGEVGLQPVRLQISDTHVIVPSSKRALEVADTFLRGQLMKHPPRHDLEIHLHMEHFVKTQAKDVDRSINRLVDRARSGVMRSRVAAGHKEVTDSLAKSLVRKGQAVKSTRRLLIFGDVSQQGFTLSFQGTAAKGGRLEKLIRRQQPGPPFGAGLLPASSWLYLSDRGNPEAKAEGLATWEPAIKQLFVGLKKELGQRASKAVSETLELVTGDMALALHRAPTGSGMTLSLIGKLGSAERGKAVLKQLADALGDLFKAMLANADLQLQKSFTLQRSPFAHQGATGEMFRVKVDLPSPKREQIEKTVGLPLALGIAVSGQMGLVTLGKGAEEQLKQLVEGVKSGKVENSLAASKAFVRAQSAAKHRVGLLYISLLDMVRWFEGTGVSRAEALIESIKGKAVSSAPSLDWGVDDGRRKMDFTVRLPVEHFRSLKAVIDQYMKQQTGGLLGAGKPQWRDL